MIAQALDRFAAQTDSRAAVCASQRQHTYQQLHQRAVALANTLAAVRGRSVAIDLRQSDGLVTALAAANLAGMTAVVYPPALAANGRRHGLPNTAAVLRSVDGEISLDRGDAGLHREECEASQRGDDVVLFTSGTSGPSKPVVYSWSSLAAAVRYDERYANRHWLCAYEPASFAGLQVMLQALLTGGTLVAPDNFAPAEIAQILHRRRVEFACGTPTFWRNLLATVDAEELCENCVGQVTLGGEPADQKLLDALRHVFHDARISHIYATTELGVCFAVHDGQAGFPAAWLQEEEGGLRVSASGELQVRRDNAWVATGDMVEIRGDRVLFAGRCGDAIHVGGSKVQPAIVEDVIRAVPQVDAVRVYGIASSLAGQLVAAQVQPRRGSDEEHLRREILAACRVRLPKYMVPAVIDFEPVTVTSAGKLARGGG
jgi:acyl-CoA synthetase (AMP-forming)/AMP-acid ligase II